MNKAYELFIPVIRILLGWVFFYAGITKVFNPNWSAAFYLKDAKTFSGLYEFLLQPQILPFINFLNEWGLTILGLSLILGVFVRYSAPLGALMMFLYYLPILDFPKVGDHSYLVDEHIIYATVLLFLAAVDAG